jgi:hypothetical protein
MFGGTQREGIDTGHGCGPQCVQSGNGATGDVHALMTFLSEVHHTLAKGDVCERADTQHDQIFACSKRIFSMVDNCRDAGGFHEHRKFLGNELSELMTNLGATDFSNALRTPTISVVHRNNVQITSTIYTAVIGNDAANVAAPE